MQVVNRSKIIVFRFPLKQSLLVPHAASKVGHRLRKTEAWAKQREEVERTKRVKVPAEEEEVYMEERLRRVWVYFYLSVSIAPLSN